MVAKSKCRNSAVDGGKRAISFCSKSIMRVLPQLIIIAALLSGPAIILVLQHNWQ
ncbi:hypothetical protein [Azospirillum rugosum]|uniref:Uncharacterized protein n=1 Tax=Azospirillum rugosum TaxID=416170 RepID=A0ABS4SXH4_9PROT|nr:hypothetical protein [Azospirillum rugosum]MBP2297240.1 hypothetical protein [Azospirillum rugosum]MDQ0531082.1 hypothetical protein [Azospirillum rugosum]